MKFKFIEIRDTGTCIPALAIKTIGENSIERAAFRRTGYGQDDDSPTVLLVKLNDPKAECDPYDWPDKRTMRAAHVYLETNWDAVADGTVLDVRVTLGESTEPAISEIFK